jgi:UDP-N-acetylmuramyl pentapeptide phosphotransferase/UDP-N-acetylglucosamine-1-phosphate transferase
MGGGLMLAMVACMILGSFVLQYMGWINNSLFNQKETYLLVFGFFCMGGIGLVDDYMNIQGT